MIELRTIQKQCADLASSTALPDVKRLAEIVEKLTRNCEEIESLADEAIRKARS